MNATEIKAKIEKIRNNKMFPEGLKASAIKKWQDQLDALEDKPAKTKKAGKKPAVKKAKPPGKPQKARKVSTPKLYKGKKLTDLDEAACEDLLKDIAERREAAKKSAAKSAAKPVIEKIVNNLATGVKQAINDVPAKDAKKAKVYLKKAVSGIKSVANLLRKAIGDDTKKARVEAIFKELIDLINEK